MNNKIVSTPETRRDRLVQERRHDPYKAKGKLPEPTVCPVCRAVYRDGRWAWAESWPSDAHKETCQACLRTQDQYPAGVVTLSGAFTPVHKDELIHLIRNTEQAENREHPLHRIMDITPHADKVVVRTTDIHLPRRIADALRHAYKGEVDIHYDEEGYLARVNWRRDTL